VENFYSRTKEAGIGDPHGRHNVGWNFVLFINVCRYSRVGGAMNGAAVFGVY